MATVDRFDAIIIGAGQAGVPLARYLAGEAHLRTALIERDHVGGTCVNRGCTPTKTMVASARVAALLRRAEEYGVHAGHIEVDMARVRDRQRGVVASWRGGSERRLRQTEGLELISGDARFAGPRELEVRTRDSGVRRLVADRIFINAGGRPATPPIPGLEGVGALDSTSILDLDRVPAHLLVLGGGYVGLEFGQMFRRFGAAVTIIQRRSHLLPQEDEDVSAEIAAILRDDGIEVLLETEAAHASRGEDHQVRLHVRSGRGERTLTGSHLLVAAGRIPNTEALNLPAAGIETDERGFIRASDRLETTAPGVFALGDVKGGPAFTHMSYDDFRIIRANLTGQGPATITGRLVPYTVFIDPELGRVGLTEKQARDQGRNVQVAKMPMSHVARAIEMGETRGFMKAVVDADTSRILGCAVLGVQGGEVMSIIQMAMAGNVPYEVLRENVFSHPTLAEALNNLFLSWEPEPVDAVVSKAS